MVFGQHLQYTASMVSLQHTPARLKLWANYVQMASRPFKDPEFADFRASIDTKFNISKWYVNGWKICFCVWIGAICHCSGEGLTMERSRASKNAIEVHNIFVLSELKYEEVEWWDQAQLSTNHPECTVLSLRWWMTSHAQGWHEWWVQDPWS